LRERPSQEKHSSLPPFILGILLAVFLRGISNWISQHIHLRESWSLVCVLLLLVTLGVGTIWFLAPDVASQINELSQRLAEATQKIQSRIQQYAWIKTLLERGSRGRSIPLPSPADVFKLLSQECTCVDLFDSSLNSGGLEFTRCWAICLKS